VFSMCSLIVRLLSSESEVSKRYYKKYEGAWRCLVWCSFGAPDAQLAAVTWY